MLDPFSGLGGAVRPPAPEGVTLLPASRPLALRVLQEADPADLAGGMALSGLPPVPALMSALDDSAVALAALDESGSPAVLFGLIHIEDGVGWPWLLASAPAKRRRGRSLVRGSRAVLDQWHHRWPLMVTSAWRGSPSYGRFLRALGFHPIANPDVAFAQFVRTSPWPS